METKSKSKIPLVVKKTYHVIAFCSVLTVTYLLVKPCAFCSEPFPVCDVPDRDDVINDHDKIVAYFRNYFEFNTCMKDTAGMINKNVLCNLYNNMRDAKDTVVYYVYARTTNDASGQNIIMLFNDPAFHDLGLEGGKYLSCPPYCPPVCSTNLVDFLR
jgi:hypothetical protein